jgi:hypothetical protein
MKEPATAERSETPEKPPEGWTSVLTIIPEMFYDLLARVFPGMALVLAFSVYSADIQNSIPAVIPLSTNVFVLLVLSYLAGMILNAVSALLSLGVLPFSLWVSGKIQLDIGAAGTKDSFVKYAAVAAKRLDDISIWKVEAARVLIKMTAEVEICQSLAAGILVFFAFLNFLPPFSPPGFAYPIKACVAGLVLFILLLAASCLRVVTYWARLNHLYEISQRQSLQPFPNPFQAF